MNLKRRLRYEGPRVAHAPGSVTVLGWWRGDDEMRKFYLGLDLGKMQDHSAVAVIEKDRQGRREVVVRVVRRIPLGTPYRQVLETLRGMVGTLQSMGTCRAVVGMLNEYGLSAGPESITAHSTCEK